VISVEPAFLARFVACCGRADPAWVHTIAIPDDPRFPTLQVPNSLLAYARDRAYSLALAARVVAAAPQLFAQLTSFAAADGGGGWAIPLASTPHDERAALRQALGFDEGWELARLETMFVCDEAFGPFWEAALERGRFGLTVPGAGSLYPVSLGEPALEAIDAFLGALNDL